MYAIRSYYVSAQNDQVDALLFALIEDRLVRMSSPMNSGFNGDVLFFGSGRYFLQ